MTAQRMVGPLMDVLDNRSRNGSCDSDCRVEEGASGSRGVSELDEYIAVSSALVRLPSGRRLTFVSPNRPDIPLLVLINLLVITSSGVRDPRSDYDLNSRDNTRNSDDVSPITRNIAFLANQSSYPH